MGVLYLSIWNSKILFEYILPTFNCIFLGIICPSNVGPLINNPSL